MKIILPSIVLLISVANLNAQCWKTVSGGGGHTLAIKIDGTLWAWGWNEYGQVGDGSFTNKPYPIKIGTATDWKIVSAGNYHSLAIKNDGTLWGWGRNIYGQAGDGTYNDRNTPAQIGTATNWKDISGGGLHSLALKTDGTLWAWGTQYENGNYYGILGTGGMINETQPVQVGIANNWKNISAGYIFSLAIKSDGTRWAWGSNNGGYLGDGGTYPYQATPLQIGTETDWVICASGYAHTLAQKTNGSLWSWGLNYAGQLGDGTNTHHPSPIQVGTDIDWKIFAGATWHSIALKNDGTIWTWGRNIAGELGDGTYNPSLIPKQIGTSNNWRTVESGHIHSLAIDNNGDLWTWGYNEFGGIGDSTFVNKPSPIKLPCGNLLPPPPPPNAVDSSCRLEVQTKLWPNPVSNVLIVDKNPTLCKVTMDLYNSVGQLIIKGRNIQDGHNEIALLNLAAGIYYYKFISNEKSVLTGSIFKYY